MIKIVYPSAGHNNFDPGAVYNGIKEADKTKELRNLISKHLGTHKHITDYDCETNRQHQNRIKPGSGSVLADHHFDASPNTTVSGVGVFVATNANANSLAMAKEVAEGLSKIMGIPNRGVKTEAQSGRGRLGILHLGAGIAILVEVCFLSNPCDMAKYEANKEKVAKFLADIYKKWDDKIV
jgi:N-acetylmuramoyl-L-alanine amidase